MTAPVTRIARLLGWFSAALGLAQLIAPSRLLAVIGVRPTAGRVAITRVIGVRELSVVPGLLTATLPVGWLAARVAGDLMDLPLLLLARTGRGNDRARVGAVTLAVGAIAAADVAATIAARRAARARSRHGDRIVNVVTVNRPVEELYAFWRDLENLPRVMPHLESVTTTGAGRSHWVARAPFGAAVEWDAEVVGDVANERISWRSMPGSQIQNAGTVRFAPAPAGRGTEVTVEMEYRAPGGAIGAAVAKLSGEEPRQQVADALRRFRQVMETGEPILSEATASGHKVFQHPGQPSEPEAIEIGGEAVGAGRS